MDCVDGIAVTELVNGLSFVSIIPSVESTTISAGYYDDQEIELSQVVQNIPVSNAEDFSLRVSYSGRKTLTVANDCLCFASASFISQDCDTDYHSYYNWGATYYIAYSCIFYGPDGDVLYDVFTDLTYKSKGGSSSKQLYYLPKDSVIEIYYSPQYHGNYNDGGGVSGTFIYLDT